MIDRVSGSLLQLSPTAAIVDVGGVGFEVAISPATAERLGPLGDRVTLLTAFLFVGSQDAQPRLYGFATPEGRALFHLLRGVSGVGPNTALRVTGALPTAGDVAAAIARGDAASIKVKGVGPKIAKRIVTELKEKVGAVLECLPTGASPAAGRPTQPPPGADPELEQAFLALRGLEFDPQKARELLLRIRVELSDAPADELVRQVLVRA